jgi:cytochrome c-type biogenesis protein CcmH/NrfF
MPPITHRKVVDWLVPVMLTCITATIGWVANSIGTLAGSVGRLSESVAVAVVRLDNTEKRVTRLEDDDRVMTNALNDLYRLTERLTEKRESAPRRQNSAD